MSRPPESAEVLVFETLFIEPACVSTLHVNFLESLLAD